MSRLRDISHEAEIESRRKIQELERDLASLDDIQCAFSVVYLSYIVLILLHSSI